MLDKIFHPQALKTYAPYKACNGYTLFGPRGSNDMWLVNMGGEFVHHWQLSTLVGDAKLLESGNLIIGSRLSNSPVADLPACGGKFLELDWEGNVVWEYEDLYLNIHDCHRLKNGNTLMSRMVPIPSELSTRIKGGIPGSERQGEMWSDAIQEVTRDGRVVWEWVAYEHMDVEKDILCPLCSRAMWTYINSLDALANGDILVSLRHINTVAIIERKGGRIIWRWGPGKLGHQHCPSELPNGNILIFDNGLHTPSRDNVAASSSRVLEVNPKTDEIEWIYHAKNKPSFFSPICSSTQRLQNGNTLICEATKGRIFEVTHDREIVWEFHNPFYYEYQPNYLGWTNMVYRAYRYATDYEGLRDKNLNPGGFEWMLAEKSGKGMSSVEDRLVEDRLKMLGY